jgi:hypothetical protein
MRDATIRPDVVPIHRNEQGLKMNGPVDPDSRNESVSAQATPGDRLSVWPSHDLLETYRESAVNRA